ncbi:MAG: ion channel, partial [Salinispira sp.]
MPEKNRRFSLLRTFISSFRSLATDFKREHLHTLLMAFFTVVVIGGGIVFLIERDADTGVFRSPLDALWWGIVTLTTVGYGDYAPVSLTARVISVTVMLSGVVITSILSGTIASIYVDRKIREGKGLSDITLKNHTIICGWNRYGRGLIESLLCQFVHDVFQIVIISEMTPEDFDDLKIAFPNTEIKFIRGDIASEAILMRANIYAAKNCIIIPDESGGKSFLSADDKTILSALAVKGINADIHLTAQIIHDQNAAHLERAQVDEVVYGDEIIRHILSSSTVTHGIPMILQELLDPISPKRLNIQKISSSFIGKPFGDYAAHLISGNK